MKQVEDIETAEILKNAQECLSAPGDFVELGCYEGDTSLLLAELLKKHNSDKKLWLYDSFEGLPQKQEEDASEAGKNFVEGALFVSKREVKQRFLRANLKLPIIKKAWFCELDREKDLPEKIAFAFLDGDLYQSIKDSFIKIDGKLSQNGIIMVHDYNNAELPGVTKAVDEYLQDKNYKTSLKNTILTIRIS